MMYDFMPLRPYLEPFFLPKFFRVIEMAFVFGLFYLKFIKQINFFLKNRFFVIFALFLVFQIFRCFTTGIEIFPYRLLSIFSNYGFFLVFAILAAEIKNFSIEDLKWVFNFYKKYFFFNIIISFLIVMPLAGFKAGDFFNGLYYDSHLFGTYMYVASTLFFFQYYLTKTKKYLIYSFLFLILQFFPSNEKVMLFNILVYFQIIFLFSKNKIKFAINFILISLFSAIVIFVVGKYLQSLGDWRIFTLLEKYMNYENLGFLLSWPLLFSKLNNMWDLLLGIGPGFYAGQGAQQLYMMGYELPLSDIFKFQFANVYFNSGFQILWNKLTIIIGEYGFIGLLIFLYSHLFLCRQIKNAKNILTSYKFLFYSCLAVILFQDIINNSGGHYIMLFPIMLIPSFSYKKNETSK